MYRIIVISLLTASSPVSACNIPVFRFALERWEADRYQIEVIHRGPLTAQQKTKVEALRKFVEDRKIATNFELVFRDFNKSAAEVQEGLLETYNISQFPWVFVRYPENADPENLTIYSGPIDLPALAKLIDSPARRELGRRLLGGESVVWVFVQSGKHLEDEIALAKLKRALERLSKELTLPELSDSPRDKLLRQDLPLKLSFSILRVSHADPAERHFISILQNMERGLRKSEPMVFPIFGRGLVLYGLVGRGITDTEENIEHAATVLTSKCTCEAKEMNPGVSLLMTADWENELAGQIAAAPRTNSSITLTRQDVPQPSKMAGESTSTTTEALPVAAIDFAGLRSIALGVAAGLVVVALGTFLLSLRNRI